MTFVATFFLNFLCAVTSCESRSRPTATSTPIIYITTSKPEPNVSATNALNDVLQLDSYVDTKYGGLNGYTLKTSGDRRIYAFEGIPYAEPPVGYFRFRPAHTKQAWGGVRDARKPGPVCMQLDLKSSLKLVGSEDCLYLNVYSPQIPYIDQTGKQVYFEPIPVIVWIHGGGYYYGSGEEFGPSYLLDKDVILVTINFRLGVLGFMSSGDYYSPGNYGLKDQALAMEWIHENIASFGGDPDKVTIMGVGSGGASCHLHLIANKTTQYFRSGASLSGSGFSHWAIQAADQAKRLSDVIAKQVKCPVEDRMKMVDCLRQSKASDLVAAQYKLLEFPPFPYSLFGPVLEPPGRSSYLAISPSAAYALNDVEAKPWIFGVTANEGYIALLWLEKYSLEQSLRHRWNELAPIFLDYKHVVQNISGTTARISRFYFGNKTLPTVPRNRLAAAFGDRLLLPGIHHVLDSHSRIAPTYAYIFGFRGKYALGNRRPEGFGVGHTEDIYYFLNSSKNFPTFQNEDISEKAMSNIMKSIFSNFASKGEPLLTQPNGINARIWESIDPGSIKFLNLNKNIEMIPEPFLKRTKFWMRLGQKEPRIINPLYDLPLYNHLSNSL